MTNGASGINTDEFTTDIGPRDDLFMHVHAKWLERTEIPSDKARWGSFAVLADTAEDAVKQIVTETKDAAAGTEDRKIGDLYASFMDEAKLNELGGDPIRPQLAEVDAVSSVTEFLTLLGRGDSTGGPGFIGQFVDTDFGSPDTNILFWMQGGIGLPDESYYREEPFEEVREKYREYLERMLDLLGEQNAAEQAERIWNLEVQIAKLHWNKVDARDFEKMYNVIAVRDEFPELLPFIDAVEAPSHAFDKVVVGQPDFIAGAIRLLTADNLEAWKSWAKLSIIRGSAAYLSTEISKANFDFYGTALTGTTEQRARWKRGVGFVEGAIGDAVGRAYVERHFSKTAKARMQELIGNLVWAYEDSIKSIDWMGDETKKRALDKLAKFTPKIGYPVKWRSYEGLEVTEGDLLRNVRQATHHEHLYEMAKVGGPIDRDEWEMSPQTVNAYYHPGRNEIVFPAAILQPPFFDETWDDAAIHGAIGSVIGHEIGHGFDDQGSKFDGDGQLVDWWTEADREAFEERTKSLTEQYNALAPYEAPDHKVNGELTLGENIGDLGGLGIAWKAYQHALGGSEAPVIDGLTGAQRFFYAWAQVWQLKIRREEAIRLVQIDPHSPNEHRTNQIVKNLDAFYDAFDVQEGDPMYLAPEERVTIW
ncbi:MAG: M13 family metallopeptidase [Agrococcus casei]|uniref:M13 family metallopeptidase n=1 Tax=Agrococcus casei TaxID=343512 RepID=UPI003F97E0BD